MNPKHRDSAPRHYASHLAWPSSRPSSNMSGRVITSSRLLHMHPCIVPTASAAASSCQPAHAGGHMMSTAHCFQGTGAARSDRTASCRALVPFCPPVVMSSQTASCMGLPYTLASFLKLHMESLPAFQLESGRFSMWVRIPSRSCTHTWLSAGVIQQSPYPHTRACEAHAANSRASSRSLNCHVLPLPCIIFTQHYFHQLARLLIFRIAPPPPIPLDVSARMQAYTQHLLRRQL